VSAVAKASAAVAGAAGTGTWITLTGWPAVAAVGAAAVLAEAALLWVLADDGRTNRLYSLITAFRSPRR